MNMDTKHIYCDIKHLTRRKPMRLTGTTDIHIAHAEYSTGSRYEECYASPRVWYPSRNSPDGRERQNKGSSKEDSAGHQFDGCIEEDRRVGGPYMCRIPCLWIPLAKHHSQYQRLVEDAADIKAEVERILVAAGITPASLRFGGRISEVDNEDSPELFHYIRRQDLPKINVEIAGMQVFLPHEFAPVVADDRFWDLWKRISDEIAESGKEYQVMFLILCHMGKSKDYTQNPVTAKLQIGAKAENRDYRPLRERLVRLLDDNGWYYIAVLILCGEATSLTHCPMTNSDEWASI
ncbi:hypothetical protein BJX68DRAFT_268921 [Aspergillus pseudodeflectus]|uniref:Uncharacterized protein n=1 Tax=Aspergillus pseudodeflectus TaxID=176178 RepID=A0ABR4K1B8_9EURO